MRRLFLVAITTAFLGGCALPLPVTVASWAMDGLSLLTTDKTLTDHGLSAVSGRDCALWRGFTDGDVCRDDRGNVLVPAAPSLRAPVEVAAMQPLIGAPYLRVQ